MIHVDFISGPKYQNNVSLGSIIVDRLDIINADFILKNIKEYHANYGRLVVRRDSALEIDKVVRAGLNINDSILDAIVNIITSAYNSQELKDVSGSKFEFIFTYDQCYWDIMVRCRVYNAEKDNA